MGNKFLHSLLPGDPLQGRSDLQPAGGREQFLSLPSSKQEVPHVDVPQEALERGGRQVQEDDLSLPRLLKGAGEHALEVKADRAQEGPGSEGRTGWSEAAVGFCSCRGREICSGFVSKLYRSSPRWGVLTPCLM